MMRKLLGLVLLSLLALAFMANSGCGAPEDAGEIPQQEAAGDVAPGGAGAPAGTDVPTEMGSPAGGGPGVNPPPPIPGEGQ